MPDIIIPRTREDIEAEVIHKVWKPFSKQEIFISLPDSIKEGFYGGGAGSAKTESIVMLPLCRGWHKLDGFKQLILRTTNPELKKEIIPRTKLIYPKFGATWNGQDMTWTFPSEDQFGSGGLRSNAGAIVICGHCETDDDVHIYDGVELNCFSPDELTSLTEYKYLYIGFTRTRAKIGSNLPAVIRAGGMPGDIGHTWVKKRLIDPAPKGGKILIGRGGNKRIYIFANYKDNPHLGPQYGIDLQQLPEAEREAKLGNWEAYQGLVFNELRTKHYPDEPDNALHKIPAFNIPTWWPKMIIGDWGYSAMTYVGFYAISPTARLYQFKELHWIKTKIAEWAPILKGEISRLENVKTIKFCKSAAQDRGQEHTIQQQIEDELGESIELSVNSQGSRVAGKLLVHEYLRWNPRPVIPPSEMPIYNQEYADWVLRNKTMDDYNAYLSIFNPPEPEINIPKLQIFEECELMFGALQACSYAKSSKEGKAAEDVAEFPGDDPYDTLRYACDSAERYFEESANEFQQVQQRQKLLETLQNTQDWTAFYRNARALEAQNSTQVVRMFHRRRH